MGIETVTKMQEVITKVYRCDLCNVIADSAYRCVICGRLTCNGHTRGEYDGDSYTPHCIVCWKVGEDYRKRIELVKDECDANINMIEKQWYSAALKAHETQE